MRANSLALTPGTDFKALCLSETEKLFDIVFRALPTQPQICCFATHSEEHHHANGLLTMWRLYGGSDGGIALGFNTKHLSALSEQIIKNTRFEMLPIVEVLYGNKNPAIFDRIKDSPKIAQLLFNMIEVLLQKKNIDELESMEELIDILLLSICFKHADFEDEREVRIMAMPSFGGDSKNRNTVEFINERILIRCLSTLTEVVIGPHEQQTAMADNARGLLDYFGYDDVDVRTSATPFRQLRSPADRGDRKVRGGRARNRARGKVKHAKR